MQMAGVARQNNPPIAIAVGNEPVTGPAVDGNDFIGDLAPDGLEYPAAQFFFR